MAAKQYSFSPQGLANADLVGHLPTDAPDSNQFTELLTHWRNTVIQIAKVHCCPPHTKPSTNRNPGPSRPRITQELLSAIKDKHKRYRTYLKDKSNSNWRQFTTIRNKVTTLQRNSKSVFVQSATTDATRNDRLHHIMKCLKQKTATPIPDLHHPPHKATTAQDKANMLNRFFIQQSEQSVADSPPTTPPTRTTPDITSTLHTITTSAAEVESLLKQLNTKKSPGHDGIPTRLLKEAAAKVAPSLAVLYNLSFQTGDIPQDWKDATVSPIHKKRCQNYHPISLLSITSKIQEKIVYSCLYKHILPIFRPTSLASANMTAQSCSWPAWFIRSQLLAILGSLSSSASLTLAKPLTGYGIKTPTLWSQRQGPHLGGSLPNWSPSTGESLRHNVILAPHTSRGARRLCTWSSTFPYSTLLTYPTPAQTPTQLEASLLTTLLSSHQHPRYKPLNNNSNKPSPQQADS